MKVIEHDLLVNDIVEEFGFGRAYGVVQSMQLILFGRKRCVIVVLIIVL